MRQGFMNVGDFFTGVDTLQQTHHLFVLGFIVNLSHRASGKNNDLNLLNSKKQICSLQNKRSSVSQLDMDPSKIKFAFRRQWGDHRSYEGWLQDSRLPSVGKFPILLPPEIKLDLIWFGALIIECCTMAAWFPWTLFALNFGLENFATSLES